MINSNKALDLFISFVYPSALGRCDVRWKEVGFFYTWVLVFVWSDITFLHVFPRDLSSPWVDVVALTMRS